MSKVGFIKDWRQELVSDIWLMPPMYHRVWQWLKYSVNHSQGKIPNKDGTFTIINPGQHATSYRMIAQGVGYYKGGIWREPNVKTIKSILDWLVGQKMIQVESNAKGTIVTIENWGLYQSKEIKSNTKRRALATQKKHQMDTKKNGKNEKNEKKSNKQTEKSIIADRNFALPVREIIEEWIAYKKEKRQPYTPIGLKQLLTQIENNISKYGEKAMIETIGFSMASNYQGIVWDRLKKSKRQGAGRPDMGTLQQIIDG